MTAERLVNNAQVVDPSIVILDKFCQEFFDFRPGNGAVLLFDQIVMSGFDQFNIVHALEKRGQFGISVISYIKFGELFLQDIADFAQRRIFSVVIVVCEDPGNGPLNFRLAGDRGRLFHGTSVSDGGI